MSFNKDRKRAKKHKHGRETPLMLLMGLASIQERALACIVDDTVRSQWDTKLEAQMELIYQAIKEPNDG